MRPLLMITHNPFWRADRGSRQRICSLVRALSTHGWRVHVVFDGALETGIDQVLDRTGLASIVATGVDPLPNGVRTARGWSLDAYRSEAMPEVVREACAIVEPAAVLCQQIRHAYLLDECELARDTLRVCDTHDVMHERCRQFAAFGYEHWVDISREQEAAVISRFDLLVAIHEEDAAVLRSMTNVPVVSAPHTPAMTGEPLPPAAFSDASVGFIGCAGHANRDAVQRLLKRVWPRALEMRPDLRLVIAGDAGALESIDGGIPGLTAMGAVAEIEEFYRRVSIVVNPVRFGGGLKIKNVEALYHGRPLVTTPAGVYGMRDAGDAAAIVCESDEEIARAIVMLASDERRHGELSAAGRNYARTRFDPDRAYNELLLAMGGAREAAA